MLGTSKEKRYYNNFKQGNKIINLCGLPLGSSVFIMKNAQRIYTTDCGAMHLAATQNNNITCFFGPTNPEVKAPRVKNIRTHWTDKEDYDINYEKYGKIPNKKYFKKLNIKEVKK